MTKTVIDTVKVNVQKIRSLLEDKDIHLCEIENVTQIAKAALSNVLNGKTNSLRLDAILTLAKYLDCSIEDLLLWEKKRPKTRSEELLWNSYGIEGVYL